MEDSMEIWNKVSLLVPFFSEMLIPLLCIGCAVMCLLLAKFVAPQRARKTAIKKTDSLPSGEVKEPSHHCSKGENVVSEKDVINNDEQKKVTTNDEAGNAQNQPIHTEERSIHPNKTSEDNKLVKTQTEESIVKAFIPASKKVAPSKPSSGVPDYIEKYFMQCVLGKSLAIKDKESSMLNWMKKYESIKSDLSNRPELDVITQAKKELQNGNLEGAERFLKNSLAYYKDAVKKAESQAAQCAYDIGKIKELQFAPINESQAYFSQALQLEPGNITYLELAGCIKNTISFYDQAIAHYEEAYVAAKKQLGDIHPHVLGILQQLNFAKKEHYLLSRKKEYEAYAQEKFQMNKDEEKTIETSQPITEDIS